MSNSSSTSTSTRTSPTSVCSAPTGRTQISPTLVPSQRFSPPHSTHFTKPVTLKQLPHSIITMQFLKDISLHTSYLYFSTHYGSRLKYRRLYIPYLEVLPALSVPPARSSTKPSGCRTRQPRSWTRLLAAWPISHSLLHQVSLPRAYPILSSTQSRLVHLCIQEAIYATCNIFFTFKVPKCPFHDCREGEIAVGYPTALSTHFKDTARAISKPKHYRHLFTRLKHFQEPTASSSKNNLSTSKNAKWHFKAIVFSIKTLAMIPDMGCSSGKTANGVFNHPSTSQYPPTPLFKNNKTLIYSMPQIYSLCLKKKCNI